MATLAPAAWSATARGSAKAAVVNGRSRFTGSAFADFMYGYNGADTMFGGVGNDTLSGNMGADFIVGEDGDAMTGTACFKCEHAPKLAATKIRVLNASGHGGQAAEVSSALRDLGFAQPTAANDPVYNATKLTCQGQIRFGDKGKSAAAALWLVAPCTELFSDGRDDDSVDLAVGTDFTTLTHNDDIDAVLAGLRPDATEPADPALIAKIHGASC